MKSGPQRVLLGLICLTILNCAGCHSTIWRSKFYLPPIAEIDKETSFIKCHTADGHVIVLSDWDFDQNLSLIRGQGIRYDGTRSVVRRGRIEIPYRRVLVLEASQPQEFFNGYKGIAVGVLSGLSILVAMLLVG